MKHTIIYSEDPDFEPIELGRRDDSPEMVHIHDISRLLSEICFRSNERIFCLEPHIMKDPYRAYYYTKYVIKDRWPEAESYIMENPGYAYCYARYVIKDRWPEAEPIIMKDPRWAYQYAKNIIEGPWPEAESYMMKSRKWWPKYQLM